MFAEVEKFFTALLGDGVDTTFSRAFFICFSILIIYAFIFRPFINLVVGKNGSRFFDVTVAILIVLVGAKTLYPDILTEGGYTKTDLDSYYDQGYSDGYDRGEGEGYDAGYADGLKEAAGDDEPDLPVYDSIDAAATAIFGALDPDADLLSYVTHDSYPWFYGGTDLYINAQSFTVSVWVELGELRDFIEVSSAEYDCSPAFTIGDETYYFFPSLFAGREEECFFFDSESSDYKYFIPGDKMCPF